MATRLEGLYLNITSDDESYIDSPAKYIKFEDSADKLVFSETQPVSMSESDLDAAQTIISGHIKEIANLYLWDNSAGIFRNIPLAGSSASRYVFCLHMTGSDGTLSEPKLQIWDDNTHTTNNLVCLGEGNPLLSFIHVIETRIGGTTPPSWTGTLISGDTSLGLNGGESLTEVMDLYFNLYVKIPADVASQEKENPVFCFRYLYGD